MTPAPPILSLRISAGYRGRADVLCGLELDVQPGEILGLVGQSGSGKSTLALAVLRLLEWKGGHARGSIRFQQRELMACSEREMRRIRGRDIGLVLQSPQSSMNPMLSIGTQLREAWRAHSPGDWRRETPRIRQFLESLGIPGDESFLRRLPRQISIGQAQRVLIAMAVIHQPSLLIADEPTSALDAVTQSDTLKLLAHLNREHRMAVLYISHDLLAVASFCHRAAILHAGRVVEIGNPRDVFREPRHPYTRQLIVALPGSLWQSELDRVAGQLEVLEDGVEIGRGRS